MSTRETFYVAVGAVVAVVGGAVGEDVLVADGVVDLGEVVGELASKDGAEAEAASHGSEGFELVLGLEVVEVTDASAHAGASVHLVKEGAGADGEDGDILTALTLARILSRVSLEKVSRPVPMRMMYLRPSMRLTRSSVS